ncbi:MAG: ACP S-malonyltransferase, partial [Alphaproteobacteria bacterium]
GLADTARLLKKRGQAMQAAVPVGEGAMAALLGPSEEQVAALIEAASGGEVLAVANDNAPGQLVISGKKSAVDRAVEMAKDHGVKKAMPLSVSAPFHCSLMQPAADVMAAALAEVTFRPPAVPVIANVTALPVSDPNALRSLLVDQVTGKVRWRETIASLSGLEVSTVIEIGAGKVLSGMNKRISKELNSQNVETPADVEAFLATL